MFAKNKTIDPDDPPPRTKRAISIRLYRDVIEPLRTSSAAWQSHADDGPRKALRSKAQVP